MLTCGLVRSNVAFAISLSFAAFCLEATLFLFEKATYTLIDKTQQFIRLG
jgi:hypothetical protein